jgi:hypothetical protein
MARLRSTRIAGTWMVALRAALEHQGLFDAVQRALAPDARESLTAPGESASEGHELAIYEQLLSTVGVVAVRTTARFATRIALQRLTMYAGSFVEMQLALFDRVRPAGPSIVCVEEDTREAVLEISGSSSFEHPAFQQAILGQHEGVLRHLRYAGQAELVAEVSGTLRTKTRWAGALSGSATVFR